MAEAEALLKRKGTALISSPNHKTAADAIVGALNELKKDGTYDKLLDQYGVLKIDEPSFSIKGPGPA